MIICYTVPEIWHITDVIGFFHFGLFFALYLPNSPKNQNYKKMKKLPGGIIILQQCTKNHDPNSPKNPNFSKKRKKNTWRYYLQ